MSNKLADDLSLKDKVSYKPYNIIFNNGDEIRISIQQQNMIFLRSKTSFYIYRKIVKITDNNTAPTTMTLINNAICRLVEEIRYELNSVEIYKNRNVRITSLIKSSISFNKKNRKKNIFKKNFNNKFLIIDVNNVHWLSIKKLSEVLMSNSHNIL